jgi:hypothetical protein
MEPGHSGGLAVNAGRRSGVFRRWSRTGGRTGGRLGGILTIGAVRAGLEAGLATGTSIPSGGTTLAGGKIDYGQEPTFGSAPHSPRQFT